MLGNPLLLYATSHKEDGNLSVRIDGEEVVAPRREAFLSKYGVTPQDCVFMDTEHGDTVVHVGNSDKGKLVTGEAFITKDPGVVLYLLTADCFPVSFYDPQKQVIALAHMGWKPTDKKLAAKVIEEMKASYSSEPADIKVFIGPGIHKESYVKPTDSLAQRQNPAWKKYLVDLPNGETSIDLIGNIHDQAVSIGIQQENIHIDPTDTATSDEYFSHYRSVRTGEPEGRFATIIGLVS